MAAHLLQITIAAGTRTAISTTAANRMDARCKQVTFQNNGTHDMRVGDVTVTTTKGMLLYANGGGANAGPFTVQNVDLAELYVAGTQNDVLDVLYFD